MANSECRNREKQLAKAHPCYIQYLKHCIRLNQSKRTLGTKRCNLWLYQQWLQEQDIASPLEVSPDNVEAFVQYLSNEYAPGKRQTISKGSLSRYIGLHHTSQQNSLQASLQAPHQLVDSCKLAGELKADKRIKDAGSGKNTRFVPV